MRTESRPMTKLGTIARDERGVAVVVGLIALLSLTALVLAFLAMSSFEPQIAANLATGTQARYLAEAGIEAAFDGLAGTADWSTALSGATCSQGAIAPGTTQNSALPGMSSVFGTFTVRVRNDCNAGDDSITGVVLDAGGAATDSNSKLILVSTGTIGSSTKTITVVVQKATLPTINAALAFPGVNADVDFSGSSFTIRGIDTNTDGSNGSGSPVFGVSVGVAANETTVDTALANNQQNSVTGKSQLDSSTTTTGDNTVAYDTALTSAAVTNFVNILKKSADITINAPNSSPYSINNIGSSCGSSLSSSTCWGTDAHPKIVYVKGNSTGTTSYNALDIAGNSSGSGILIVENGNMDVSGSFNWNGPVIVTGTGVKIRYHGGGNQAIYGAVIVNELYNDGSTNLEADISGNAKIYYSTQALTNAMSGVGNRKLMSLYSWQEQ
jgi:Tfp pilus assembly protein PilX